MAPCSKEAPNETIQAGCKLCMCTVCTCGKHKLCHPKEGEPNTSSRIPHTPYPNDRRYASFVDNTTYTRDYIRKPISGSHRFVPPSKTLDNCIPPGTYVDVKSDYRANFRDFKTRPRNPITFPSPEKDYSTFYGDTTHKSDFKRWPHNVRSASRSNATPSAETGRFNGLTTYNTSFWDVTKHKPTKRLEYYDEEFYGLGFRPQLLSKPPNPDNILSAMGGFGGRFKAKTTYTADYIDPFVGHPRRGKQLKNALEQPEQRFDQDTTYNTDFRLRRKPDPCPVTLRPKPDIVTDNHLCY